MSISVYCRGIRDLNSKFAQMLAVKAACDAANTSYPPELQTFFKPVVDQFGSLDVEDKHIREAMTETDIKYKGDAMYGDGMIITLSDIPSDVKAIRVFCG